MIAEEGEKEVAEVEGQEEEAAQETKTTKKKKKNKKSKGSSNTKEKQERKEEAGSAKGKEEDLDKIIDELHLYVPLLSSLSSLLFSILIFFSGIIQDVELKNARTMWSLVDFVSFVNIDTVFIMGMQLPFPLPPPPSPPPLLSSSHHFCRLPEAHGCGLEAKKKARYVTPFNFHLLVSLLYIYFYLFILFYFIYIIILITILRADWLKEGTAIVTGQPKPKPLKEHEKTYVHNKLQKKVLPLPRPLFSPLPPLLASLSSALVVSSLLSLPSPSPLPPLSLPSPSPLPPSSPSLSLPLPYPLFPNVNLTY